MVGTIKISTGELHTLRLEGEVIENSFAVGEDGVFIVSDHVLYRFVLGKEGNVVVAWRTPYDRGSRKKPGHISRGSGTSVSLMGSPEDGFVVITDNAEPRINLLFVRRAGGEVVCRQPLFQEGRSGTDVSVVCFERADADGMGTGVYSVLVENNRGYHTFPRSRPVGGLTRVDLIRNPDGSYTCREVWTSEEKSIGVFKLSLGNGVVYMYWRNESCPITKWYLTAVDFATGKTVYKKLVGTGLGYNNWVGALFIGPDGGVLYSTTIFGLVMISGARRPSHLEHPVALGSFRSWLGVLHRGGTVDREFLPRCLFVYASTIFTSPLRLPGFAAAEPAFRAYLRSVSGYRKNTYRLDPAAIEKDLPDFSRSREKLLGR